MANKDAIVNKFNVDEATVTETIRKGKYRVFNGNDYDVVYLQTSADQVIESNDKKFVSQTEKNKWDSKADGNHNHDKVYAKIGVSHTKEEMEGLLRGKSDTGHTHAAANIVQDSSYRFVSDSEKTRWNDTFTKSQVTSQIQEVNDSIKTLEANNTSAHATITEEYKNADKVIDDKVTTVKSDLSKAVTDLTALINNGGTANTALAARVTTIEQTTIPGVKKQISDFDIKYAGITNGLSQNKADKSQVATDIATAKSALQEKIDLKSDKTYVDNQLKLKANASQVYTISQMDQSLALKADKEEVTTSLATKVDNDTFTSELAKKANDSEMKTALKAKADAQDVTNKLALKAEKTHSHATTDISGLGSAALKNIGTKSGNVPVLNSLGKLDTAVLPSIAINQKFTANSTDAAMKITMEIGDILILTTTAREAVMQKQAEGKAVTYQVGKSKNYQELSDEYITYIASGTMTYLCVDDKATTFEERFKPLQSAADTISKGEVQTLLDAKVNNSEFVAYKNQVTSKLNDKADKSTTYTKTDVNDKLDTKVDKVDGKVLSSNDFTNDLKTKLEGITAGANKYTHPSGDGNLHVPATGTISNGKVLMAGSTAGKLSWTALTADNVADSSTKKFVTPDQINKWNSKAEGTHTHTQYRLISDSFNKSETTTAINKLKTIISADMPSSGQHIEGAVWIQETF